ncbi:hypothetical protein JVT61DRAFT_6625 [Boletus reticuloceps]|uniref:Uncharacterized protein n=1 Tax=Boletus reticuloceps TaxID=495285 RepID=A0A8I2YKR0_9AGAM|nr:hypothetical protein JVT61DRAFT_6625 [Boletus reticuloceps]
MASPRLHALSRHTLRQLKFIIPGAVVTFLFNTHWVLFGLLSTPNASPGDWSRIVALLASCLGGLVVLLFLYVLLVHWLRGVEPNVSPHSYHPVVFSDSSKVPFLEKVWHPFARNPNFDRCHPRWLVTPFHHPWEMVKSRILEGHHRRYLYCTSPPKHSPIPDAASGLYALVFGLIGLLPLPIRRS